MYFPDQKFVQIMKRAIRITLSILIIGIANTATADNFITQWLSAASSQQLAMQATAAVNVVKPGKVGVAKGEMVYVVCSDEGGARVRGGDMKSVLFNADQLETLKPFQGWSQNKKVTTVNGQKMTFVRVQFDSSDDRKTNIGWIAEKFVKLKSKCPAAAAAASLAGTNTQISSLTDGKCCHFPITHKPLRDYLSGERMFGAGRARGRKHAAADLYGKFNEPILAVAQGKVIRGLYEFYDGTYAVDVKHQGGFVVRYGEVSGKRAATTSTGANVKMGQKIAHMGKLTVRPPMLHFELYRGNLKGALNVKRANKFGRRKDITDPTKYLQRWEDRAF